MQWTSLICRPFSQKHFKKYIFKS